MSTLAAGSPARIGALPILAVLTTVVLWAAAFPAIRVGLEGFSPFGLASFRFLIASALLALLALSGRVGWPARADLGRVLLAGALGIAGYNLLLNIGQLTVSAGMSSILVNTHPVIAVLLGTLLLGERVRAWGWIRIAISFAGICVIAVERSGGALTIEAGAPFVLGAALCFALQFVAQKPLLARYGALPVATWMIWGGTVMLLPFLPDALGDLPNAPARALYATVFLAVGPGALAYFAWAYALARFAVGRAASFLYLVSPTALLIAFLWLGEVPSPSVILGGVLVIGGVAVVNTLGRQQR